MHNGNEETTNGNGETINVTALVNALEAMRASVNGGIGLDDKLVDAQIRKVQAAAAASVFGNVATIIEDALRNNAAACAPADGSGSALVFGGKTFGQEPIVLPDGRKVRWNVQVVLERK